MMPIRREIEHGGYGEHSRRRQATSRDGMVMTVKQAGLILQQEGASVLARCGVQRGGIDLMGL